MSEVLRACEHEKKRIGWKILTLFSCEEEDVTLLFELDNRCILFKKKINTKLTLLSSIVEGLLLIRDAGYCLWFLKIWDAFLLIVELTDFVTCDKIKALSACNKGKKLKTKLMYYRVWYAIFYLWKFHKNIANEFV